MGRPRYVREPYPDRQESDSEATKKSNRGVGVIHTDGHIFGFIT